MEGCCKVTNIIYWTIFASGDKFEQGKVRVALLEGANVNWGGMFSRAMLGSALLKRGNLIEGQSWWAI